MMKRHHDAHTRKERRPMRRVVYAIPSVLTLTNLFFGVFAIITASRGNFSRAGLYVLIGGIADAIDGRVARATNTGTDIGSELDSLVDVISFGLAPALIMYFAVLNREGMDWIWSFVFVACAALRLARFNVEQAGRAKTHFHGLPSPAAGITLATYYWFSQTPLYNETNIANLPWHETLRFVMATLAGLMVSEFSYPAFPKVGIKSVREIIGLVIVFATILGIFFIPKEFFFPACLTYVAYGVVSTFVVGLIGRRARGDSPVIDRTVDTHDVAGAPIIVAASPPRLSMSADAPLPPAPPRRRRRRRPPRGDRPDRSGNGPDTPPPSSPPPAGE
jgi:CDP-diacylglycerol--serine O-phosphatidyltransferase